MEDKVKYYEILFNIINKFLEGKKLTQEEIILLANTSDQEKFIAIKLNSLRKLYKKTDDSFINFQENEKKISEYKFNSIKIK